MNNYKGKILVVDDDRNILHVVQMRLASGGYHVTATTRVEEALKLVEQKPFDLALIDLKLNNGQDGIRLMENIHFINPNIPVIIITAYGTTKSAAHAMKKGAYSYLTKPFDGHELLRQINNCLGKNRLLKEVKPEFCTSRRLSYARHLSMKP